MYLIRQVAVYALSFVIAGVVLSFLLSIIPDELLDAEYTHGERFLENVRTFLTFDYQSSFSTEPIHETLIYSGGITLSIILCTLFFLLVVGVSLGVSLAVWPRSRWLGGVHVFLSGISAVPVLVWVFVSVFVASFWRFTPGNYSGSAFLGALLLGVVCIVIGDNLLSDTIRSTRAVVAHELSKPYIRALQARGVSYRKHVFRGVVAAVYGLLVSKSAYLIAGSIVVEFVFKLQGLGLRLYNAIAESSLSGRDYDFILAATISIICVIIVLRLIGDIIAVLTDPRIRIAAH